MAGLSPTRFHLCCCVGGFWSFPQQNSFSDPESAKFKQFTPSASVHCVASKQRQLSGDFFQIWYVSNVWANSCKINCAKKCDLNLEHWGTNTKPQAETRGTSSQRQNLLFHEKFLHSEFKKTECSGAYVCRLFANLQQLTAVHSKTAMKLPLLCRYASCWLSSSRIRCSAASRLRWAWSVANKKSDRSRVTRKGSSCEQHTKTLKHTTHVKTIKKALNEKSAKMACIP